MTTSSDWKDVLNQEEGILWQGRPDSTFVWYAIHYLCLLLGLAVSGFAVIWMILAAQNGGWGWAFGLLILSMGILTMFGMPYGGPYLSRNTSYMLTNTRALIALDLPILGRRIKSYPITPEAPLRLDERKKTSVFFATKKMRGREGAYLVAVGFRRIDDAEHVFELMREIQKNAS